MSSKGQITIPKAVRQRLGLVPGAEVEFETASQGAILRRVPAEAPGIWRYLGYFQRRGIAFDYPSSLAAVADLRGRRE